MSEPRDQRARRIGVVCEGPCDFIVIEAVVAALGADIDPVITMIQPESSRAFGNAGPHGGGWKGVRAWCEAVGMRGGIADDDVLAIGDWDILIVHLDGDVAGEAELGLSEKEADPRQAVSVLRAQLDRWLGARPGDGGRPTLVRCVPLMASDLWMAAALVPERLDEEAAEHEARRRPWVAEHEPAPARLLRGVKSGGKKLVEGADLKKSAVGWRNAARDFARAWPRLASGACGGHRLDEPPRFNRELRHALDG